MQSVGLLNMFPLIPPIPIVEARAEVEHIQILIVSCQFEYGGSDLSRLWWVDLDWTPGAHQAALSLPFSAGQGEKNYNKRLVGQDQDRERSFTNYHHGQNRLNLGKINTVYCQSNQSRVMRNTTKS